MTPQSNRSNRLKMNRFSTVRERSSNGAASGVTMFTPLSRAESGPRAYRSRLARREFDAQVGDRDAPKADYFAAATATT